MGASSSTHPVNLKESIALLDRQEADRQAADTQAAGRQAADTKAADRQAAWWPGGRSCLLVLEAGGP